LAKNILKIDPYIGTLILISANNSTPKKTTSYFHSGKCEDGANLMFSASLARQVEITCN
jgi:hypothetical protein